MLFSALDSFLESKSRKHLSWDSAATRSSIPFPSSAQEVVDQAGGTENPQCSDSSGTGTASLDTLGSGARKADDGSMELKRQNSHLRCLQSKLASRDVIHETKDSRILWNIIDKVTEELYLQRLNSPFFKKNDSDPSPPCFSNDEVEINGELGHGEFCKIYEVTQFNVPESCHICFLHRGFNDPEPSAGIVDPPTVIENIPSVHVDNQMLADDYPSFKATMSQTNGAKIISSFSFNFDSNISDYDELEDDHADEYDHETRGFMKDHCLRNGVSRYAIKRIRGSLAGEDRITEAAVDLAREAQFLAALNHPNIIKIRGTCNVPGHPKFSLILDRLYDTLEVRMKKWKSEEKRYGGKFLGLFGKNKQKLHEIWVDRLLAAYDLARALAYLHSMGILHRDIKPTNVGFDIRGDIKLFDFGLAKELKPSQRVGKDQYHTSGIAGTRRYMAPEIAKVIPYGSSADVYSFGILMWEMMTLKTAFPKYTRERHYREVIVKGVRPKVPKSWPFVYGNLLERCWDPNPSERPSFQAVCQLIKFGLPDDSVGSDRSGELLLRSLRSTHGDKDITESERKSMLGCRSDSISKSIRTRCSHPHCT